MQLCSLGKFLLTMWPQKYVFDRCNSLWDHDQTGNKTCQQIFFRKRISVLADLKVSSLVWKSVFYRPKLTGKWGPHGTETNFLKFKTEMYRRIELKEYMRKMGSFVQICFLPELWLLKCQKWLILYTFHQIQQKSVTVWTRCLSASMRSFLTLSENTVNYALLNYHQQNFIVQKYIITVFFC